MAEAILTGELLTEAKTQVQHGEWGAWLSANCPFSDRTARSYMQIAKDPKRQRVADLPLREALKELAEPKRKADPEWEQSIAEVNSHHAEIEKWEHEDRQHAETMLKQWINIGDGLQQLKNSVSPAQWAKTRKLVDIPVDEQEMYIGIARHRVAARVYLNSCKFGIDRIVDLLPDDDE